MSAANLDRIKERIRALRGMTREAGCSEHEAMEAARLAMLLIDKYQLSDEDLDLAKVELAGIGGKRLAADELWWTVARICRCKAVRTSLGQGRWVTLTYHCRPTDILVAEYLHGILSEAVRSETDRFRLTPEFTRRRNRSTKYAGVKAFHEGMVARLQSRLWDLWWIRANEAGNVDLIEAEERQLLDKIDTTLARHGYTFTAAKALSPAAKRFDTARAHGDNAARRVAIDPAISGSEAVALLGYSQGN